VIGWTRDAWIDIQLERNDWRWMRKRFDQPLIAVTPEYTATTLGLLGVGEWLGDRNDFRTFSLYDPAIGKSDEQSLQQISYDLWVERYARGSHDNQRPVCWAVTPSNGLAFGPTPDKVYRVAGEYRSAPQELTADGDIPEMPAAYHRVIIVEAIRLMARSDEAFNALTAYGAQYDRLRNALVREQTPTVNMFGGGPLA
jgi:hypothetical protein